MRDEYSLQLAYEPGRITSDSDFLKAHNVGGLKRGASYGAHVEWDQKFGIVPVTLLGRARQNIDSDRGLQGDLRLSLAVGIVAGVLLKWRRAPLAKNLDCPSRS